tara:strand:- start:484 stop:948 length:465 start_codon:yes stop_codon:yes gene_type:complete
MKKIGEYTARGIVTEADTAAGNPQKIPLFDGSFKTAYRVIEFQVFPANINNSTNPDVIGKLSKTKSGNVTNVGFWRADDDNQIGWASVVGGADNISYDFNLVDPDNLVVEDLYVFGITAGSDSAPINYLVRMEKYEITDWQGALSMARDRADGE